MHPQNLLKQHTYGELFNKNVNFDSIFSHTLKYICTFYKMYYYLTPWFNWKVWGIIEAFFSLELFYFINYCMYG